MLAFQKYYSVDNLIKQNFKERIFEYTLKISSSIFPDVDLDGLV